MRFVPWVVAAVGLVGVVAYLAGGAGQTAEFSSAMGGAPNAPFASGGGGAAPDISSMSPRERAARLYDRIMRYAEEGKQDSVQVFAPMAMASFEMLEGADFDIDARYDLGRVATEAGQLNIAAAQADTILATSPTHLLGLALAARTAERQGNKPAASASWKAFLAAKDAELRKNLPEYQAHAADIEAATRVASGG